MVGPGVASRGVPHFALQRRVKLLVLGNVAVGKTSLVQRLVGSMEAPALVAPGPTVGVDFAAHAVQLEGEAWPLRLNIWDTSGDPRFRELVDGCARDMRHQDAVIIVYDVTRRNTFEAVHSWVAAVREAGPHNDPVVVLLGNKADSGDARAVSLEEGKALAKALDITLFAEVCHSAPPGSEGDVALLLRTKLLPHSSLAMSDGPCNADVVDDDVPRRCVSPAKWLQPMLRCAGFA